MSPTGTDGPSPARAAGNGIALIQLSALTKQLSAPSASVTSFLKRQIPNPTGVQLFDQLKRAVAFLKEGIVSGPHPDTTKLLVFSLRDIHALVLELDDDITDSLSADDGAACKDEVVAERCRVWLQQLQRFVVALQKDLDALLSASKHAPSSSHTSSTVSSMSTGGSCSSSEAECDLTEVAADQSVRRGQWDVLLRHSLDSFVMILTDEPVQPGPASQINQEDASTGPAAAAPAGVEGGAKKQLSKLVCRRSCLSYRDHWANKVAV